MLHFERLNEKEQQVLIDAVAEITVLIAGADGKIDTEETEWAEKLTKIRSYAGPEILREFYDRVGQQFNEDLVSLIESLPDDTDQRNEILSNKLSSVNRVFAKLENNVAYPLYKSFLSFAEHIAKESGGFLRMWSVSVEEKQWLSLPMIDEIVEIIDEEE